jgi:hypothetical protein
MITPTDLSANFEDIKNLVLQGKAIEAFEKYYGDDVAKTGLSNLRRNIMRTNTKSIAIAIISSMAIGSNAYAVDATSDLKVMPSAACQPKDSIEAAKVKFSDDALTNTSSKDAFIICPFVKDNANNGIGKTYSAIVEIQGSQGKAVLCDLTSRSRTGKFLAQDSKTSGASGLGFIALNVKQPAALSTNSSYSITCLLPLPNGQNRATDPGPGGGDTDPGPGGGDKALAKSLSHPQLEMTPGASFELTIPKDVPTGEYSYVSALG